MEHLRVLTDSVDTRRETRQYEFIRSLYHNTINAPLLFFTKSSSFQIDEKHVPSRLYRSQLRC